MALRPSTMDLHAYGNEDGALVRILHNLSNGVPVERVEISRACGAGRISRNAEYALLSALDRWQRETSRPAAGALGAARSVVAAFADGRLWLTEATEQLLSLASAGNFGTGACRLKVLIDTMETLRAIRDVMRQVILAPAGKAARKIIAEKFRRAAGGPEPQLASFDRLALRRQSVQAVARWAELIALKGMEPEQAAKAAIAEAEENA